MNDWSNRVVLITGATAGFGAAMARRFAAAGARLVLVGRRLERIEELETSLGVPILGLALDVRDRKSVLDAIDGLPAEFASIDVLINNAGLAVGLEAAWETNLDDWDVMVDTNLKGLMYMTRAVLPGMVARDRGHVVNIGSTAGTFAYPGGNAYGATKAAVKQFSAELLSDLVHTQVRVTNVEPGLCGGTEFSAVRFKGDDKRAEKVYENTDNLSADDIADAVFWAASRPAHVNINRIEMMPVGQAPAGLAVHRKG